MPYALRTSPIVVVIVSFLSWFCLLFVNPSSLTAQAAPSSDPTPLALVLLRLERGDREGAARLLGENLPVTKSRLESVLGEVDRKFDEAGRFGATAGHDVHQQVLDRVLEDTRRYEKLFALYRTLSGDETLYKRLTARQLRIEGAHYTHAGEHACGDNLNWEEAQRLYHTAMERLEAGFALAKEVNDLRVMASAKNNMGSTLIRLIEPEKAIEAYNEGMLYANQVPGEMYKGLVNLNLGNTYVWTRDPDRSLAYSQSALEGFKKMGRGTWQSNAWMNIANAQLLQQKFASAWETMRVALDLATQSGEDRVRGRALLNLGMAGLQLKKPEAAAYILEAMEWYKGVTGKIYTPIEREAILQDGYRLLSQLARATGDEAAAAKYDKLFFESIGPDPDRYGKLRASPCFAIYTARPAASQPLAPQ